MRSSPFFTRSHGSFANRITDFYSHDPFIRKITTPLHEDEDQRYRKTHSVKIVFGRGDCPPFFVICFRTAIFFNPFLLLIQCFILAFSFFFSFSFRRRITQKSKCTQKSSVNPTFIFFFVFYVFSFLIISFFQFIINNNYTLINNKYKNLIHYSISLKE